MCAYIFATAYIAHFCYQNLFSTRQHVKILRTVTLSVTHHTQSPRAVLQKTEVLVAHNNTTVAGNVATWHAECCSIEFFIRVHSGHLRGEHKRTGQRKERYKCITLMLVACMCVGDPIIRASNTARAEHRFATSNEARTSAYCVCASPLNWG